MEKAGGLPTIDRDASRISPGDTGVAHSVFASNQAEIRIEIPHRRTTLTLHWPAADAEGCARFMREFLQ